MSNWLTDNIRDIDIGSLLNVLFDNNYYELLFPFILAFAILFTALERVKLFQNKEGKPYKPVVIMISLIVTFFGVSFELSPGYSVGSFMMMMFPNISALTMGVLALYVVGSIFAKDFFSGLFDKTSSSYLYITVAVIGLGSIIFYGGVVMGFWNHLALNNTNNWNFVIAIACLILGIVFMFVDLVPFGLLLLFIVGSFVWNDGQLNGSGSILEMFVDPVIFMFTIIALLIQWMGGDNYEIEKKKLEQMEKDFAKNFKGKEFKPYQNRIYDIAEPSIQKQRKLVEKLKEKQSN